MIRGEIVVEKLESGAERLVSQEFPPLAEMEHRAIAQRIQARLAGSI